MGTTFSSQRAYTHALTPNPTFLFTTQIALPLPEHLSPVRLEEQWPLLRASALETFGQNGFFTLVHETVDFTPLLHTLRQRHIDGAALAAALHSRRPAFMGAWAAARGALAQQPPLAATIDSGAIDNALSGAGCHSVHVAAETSEKGWMTARVTAAASQAPLKCTRTWLLPRDADADAVAAGHAAISALAILTASEAMAIARGWTGRLPFVGERTIPFQKLQAVLMALCGEARAARFQQGSGRLRLLPLDLEGKPLGEAPKYAAVAAIFCEITWEGLVWRDGDADQAAGMRLPTLACGDTMLVARLRLGETSVSDDALQGNARLTAAVPPSGAVAPAPAQAETKPAPVDRGRPLSAAAAGDDVLAMVGAGVLALQAACGGRSLILREPITRAVCRLDTAEDPSAAITSVAVDGGFFAKREAKKLTEKNVRSDVYLSLL